MAFAAQPGGSRHSLHAGGVVRSRLELLELLELLEFELLELLELELLELEELDTIGAQVGPLMHSRTFFCGNGIMPCPCAPTTEIPLIASRMTPVFVTSPAETG